MCMGGGASTGLKEKEKPFAKGIVDCVSLSDIYSSIVRLYTFSSPE